MLFRAIAHVKCDLMRQPSADDDLPEVIVFCEAPDRETAHRAIPTLLSLAWGRPQGRIGYYNLDTEPELLMVSIGGDETGDARLLELGIDAGRPIYAEPSRTQLLVGPALLPRLQAAQWAVQQLQQRPSLADMAVLS